MSDFPRNLTIKMLSEQLLVDKLNNSVVYWSPILLNCSKVFSAALFKTACCTTITISKFRLGLTFVNSFWLNNLNSLNIRRNSGSAAVKAVVRVIAITTKHEDQERRNVSLFCLCYYDDGRPPAVSTMLQTLNPIGNISSDIVRIFSFTVIPITYISSYYHVVIIWLHLYSQSLKSLGRWQWLPAPGTVVAFLLFWRHLQISDLLV